MKKHLGWIGCVMAVLLLAGCGKKQESRTPTQKQSPLVQLAKAEKRDLSKTLTYTGSVEPVKVARMASPAEGPIVECSVREGDPVRKGQILVKVGRSRIAETGLEAAQEELRRQEAEFNRVEQLVKSGSLPGEQLDAARSNLKRAEAQVAAMETGASDYEIEAPWAGVVSRVWIAEGHYVSPRTPLVELYEPASLIVRISVPEQEALAVRAEQPVRVSLDAYPERHFAGKIARVYPELERATRTLTAEVMLTEDVRLLSGMFARAEVTVETVTNAVVVPESSRVVMPDGDMVAFIVDGDIARRRKVETGMESRGTVVVRNGIAAGEMVVIRGNEMLKDGAKVQVAGAKEKDGAPISSDAEKTGKAVKP